jgi:hypothetical protein
MTTTLSLIAKQTVGSGGASSVTFSNIPQTYTDLKVVYSSRGDSNTALRLAFNGVTTNLSDRWLFGTGSGTPSSGTDSFIYLNDINSPGFTANTFGNGEAYIPNYTSSNYKSVSADSVTENNGTTAYAMLTAGLWSSSAAITSLQVYVSSGLITEFSTFYLYGISNSSTQNTSVPYASGGDVITTDGSYWYHAFKYSGSFTPLKNLTADVLVVAGGGGSANPVGGGGGAGGVRGTASQSLTATNYTVTVGAGGNASNSGNGNSGGTSSFSSLLASSGGGGGGAYGSPNGTNGFAGGSGGGGGTAENGTPGSGGAGNSGSYSPVEGYAGGAGQNRGGSTDSRYCGSGGGGAGAVGGAAANNQGGAGGVGVSTYSSWGAATSTGENVSGTYYYGGGGGGNGLVSSDTQWGAGGYGGGGRGVGLALNGISGTANTGGGGGGSRNGSIAGNGGSGVVIIRYAV